MKIDKLIANILTFQIINVGLYRPIPLFQSKNHPDGFFMAKMAPFCQRPRRVFAII